MFGPAFQYNFIKTPEGLRFQQEVRGPKSFREEFQWFTLLSAPLETLLRKRAEKVVGLSIYADQHMHLTQNYNSFLFPVPYAI